MTIRISLECSLPECEEKFDIKDDLYDGRCEKHKDEPRRAPAAAPKASVMSPKQ